MRDLGQDIDTCRVQPWGGVETWVLEPGSMALGRTLPSLSSNFLVLAWEFSDISILSVWDMEPKPSVNPCYVPAESPGPSSSYHPIAKRNGAASRPSASFDHKMDYTSQDPLQGRHTTWIKARKNGGSIADAANFLFLPLLGSCRGTGMTGLHQGFVPLGTLGNV